ncbi:MAG: nitroreductase family protein [Nanoarchaeota archaeon]|nr:nitroreductase family protein [Nanoarchaeota archaeon]
METEECILARRSVRKFKRVAVEWDKVGKILEAGCAAPTAGNLQNFKIIVVLEEDKKNTIAEACFQQHWIRDAGVILVICAEPEKAKRHYGIRGERLYTIQSCAAVAENMLLMAHDQGLGSCWVGAFDEDKVKSELSIVKEARPQIILPIGYSDEKLLPPHKYKLENFVYFEKWWGRIKDMDVFMGATGGRHRRLIEKGKEALEKVKKKISG